MKKFALIVIAIALVVALQGTSYAQPPYRLMPHQGQTILIDMLYGAAIGSVLGLALYAADEDDLGRKIVQGAAIGTVAGFGVGLYEVYSVPQPAAVEIRGGEAVAFSVPSIDIERKDDKTTVSASLIRYNF